MGLERRGNRLYYYRKKRFGKRVVSEYQGGGELAELMQASDQLRRCEDTIEKEASRRKVEALREGFAELDTLIESFCREAQDFDDALFLISGYHKHSRQWRKKTK